MFAYHSTVLLMLAGSCCGASLGWGEEAAYTIVESGEGWEVRRYPATTWLTTAPFQSVLPHSGPDREEALARLTRYSEGANMAGMEVKIAMPLVQKIFPGATPATPSNSSLALPLPLAMQHVIPPAPTETGLQLVVVPEHTVVTRQFSGQAGERDWAVELTTLFRLARNAGLAVTPVPQYTAEYSELETQLARRNEVWLEVDINQ